MQTLELSSYLMELPSDATEKNSALLFITQYRMLQDDWLILEINEMVTSHINMPYWAGLP